MKRIKDAAPEPFSLLNHIKKLLQVKLFLDLRGSISFYVELVDRIAFYANGAFCVLNETIF